MQEASWGDVSKSMQITFNMMTQASANGVNRFIHASSNHVMGGYKELGGPYYTTAASLIKGEVLSPNDALESE